MAAASPKPTVCPLSLDTRVKRRTDLIGTFKMDPVYLKHSHQDSGGRRPRVGVVCFRQSCVRSVLGPEREVPKLRGFPGALGVERLLRGRW